MTTDSSSTSGEDRGRKWVAPEIREVAHLSRVIAKGQAKGKTVLKMDGSSEESMIIN